LRAFDFFPVGLGWNDLEPNIAGFEVLASFVNVV